MSSKLKYIRKGKLVDATILDRETILLVLLKQFGSEVEQKYIYQCADEWISKGHKITAGIVAYFKAYYLPRYGDKRC